ncbi:MAG: PBP1A family penicillin-binding protein [Desulfobacterales bacterium]
MLNRQKRKNEILKKRAKRKTGNWFSMVLRICFLAAGFLILGTILFLIGAYMYFNQELPKISSLKDYTPPVVTTFYSSDNQKIGEFFHERRVVTPLSQMPDMLKNAFVAAEDDRFYQHKGIDFFSIIRAFLKNIEAGSIVQGGSTITQQVTKSFFLSPEKSYERKIKEAILAYRIDKTFTKDEILFLYLNQIYLGNGAYGVHAAAENYFGKQLQELTLSECALLAGLPQAPSRYSPIRYPQRARNRQVYVLNRMVAEGYITNTQATEALNQSLEIKPGKNLYMETVPYYTEYVRQYVEKKYGRELLYNGGLRVYTAVDVEMQKTAKQEMEKGLRELDKRQGYRGPKKQIPEREIEMFCQQLEEIYRKKPLKKNDIIEGVVVRVDDSGKKVVVKMGGQQGLLAFKNMKWAEKLNPPIKNKKIDINRPGQILKIGDVIDVRIIEKDDQNNMWELSLEQEPSVQSAILCIEAETGHVKVMEGGSNFEQSQFNRATQARRQPGSAFKPIVYAAALDKEYTPATVILDTAVVYEDEEQNFVWKPKNYSRRFYGPTLFREALAQSRNLVTIKILKDIGVGYVIDYAKKLGIDSHLNRDLSLALGSSGVSLLELVNAYSVFANKGHLITPVFVTKVVDRHGNILEKTEVQKQKVIEKDTAYLITNILESVVKEGTGKRVRALNRPVAGKTGTTNDLNDAWFVGYTPQYITGTWVGFDEETSLGEKETGATAAIPIWLGFMRKILENKPVKAFEVPKGVVFAKIDAETGLLPKPESRKTIFECFKEGTVPTKYTTVNDITTEYDEFFKIGM